MTEERQESATPEDEVPRLAFDTRVAHLARVYDYWLGGKDNFAADREAGDQALEAPCSPTPSGPTGRSSARVVRLLAGELGVRQFLDIGTGIPTASNPTRSPSPSRLTREWSTSTTTPSCSSHARALLSSRPEGACNYVDADLRDTKTILDQARADPGLQPAGGGDADRHLALHPGCRQPGRHRGRVLDSVPAGSYLVLSHPAKDLGGRGPLRDAQASEPAVVGADDAADQGRGHQVLRRAPNCSNRASSWRRSGGRTVSSRPRPRRRSGGGGGAAKPECIFPERSTVSPGCG